MIKGKFVSYRRAETNVQDVKFSASSFTHDYNNEAVHIINIASVGSRHSATFCISVNADDVEKIIDVLNQLKNMIPLTEQESIEIAQAKKAA